MIDNDLYLNYELPNSQEVADSLRENFIGTMVVKIGTNVLFPDQDAGYTQEEFLARLAVDIGWLAMNGIATVIVSSGAVEFGWQKANYNSRPGSDETARLQAAAALGNTPMAMAYKNAFGGRPTALGLLTANDLHSDEAWSNTLAGVREIISTGAIPIINENDLTTITELPRTENGRKVFGDNDQLAVEFAAQIAKSNEFGNVGLVMLTKSNGIYRDGNHPETRLKVMEYRQTIKELGVIIGPGSSKGRGGMESKIKAAQLAAGAGVTVCIGPGNIKHPIISPMLGQAGTLVLPRA